MKNVLILILLLWPVISFGQDTEVDYTEYSYLELFEMIESEKDTVFMLSNARIKVNPLTDQEHLVQIKINENGEWVYQLNNRRTIDKTIKFYNVHFQEYNKRSEEGRMIYGLYNIVFEKPVEFIGTHGLSIRKCIFNSDFSLKNERSKAFQAINLTDPYFYRQVEIEESIFNQSIDIFWWMEEEDVVAYFDFLNNSINRSKGEVRISIGGLYGVNFRENNFDFRDDASLHFEQINEFVIKDNSFNEGLLQFYCVEINELIFESNRFNLPTLINFKAINNVNFIGENQFKAETSSLEGFRNYRLHRVENGIDLNYMSIDHLGAYHTYEANFKIQNPLAFQKELEQKSVFYNYFKNNFHTKEANKYYTQIKELELGKMVYEHQMNPTFSTFFKIQVNQFLRVFSNYGTQPERAIIVSLNVILWFALIYLFFPNSWDKHGRNRIVDRYNFFFNYMKRKAGIHEVYLEEQQDELMSYEQFKQNIVNSKLKVPKFFTATALPLYKWAISGTNLWANILRHVDIMHGKWDELPKSKRIWKSFLLIGAFLVAICYDIFIKILNALMLSINTFTTLGFGEIPIKGLPRYLAIIQGFIGWFMLTIFSVSLISQLLN